MAGATAPSALMTAIVRWVYKATSVDCVGVVDFLTSTNASNEGTALSKIGGRIKSGSITLIAFREL